MILRITPTERNPYAQQLPKGTIPVPFNATGTLPLDDIAVIVRELLTHYNSHAGYFDKRTKTLLIEQPLNA